MEKKKYNHDGSNALKLRSIIEERNRKLSKANRVKSLLQKQKGIIKAKESLTDFKEPVFDLVRRDGRIETYEKATAGNFVFTHSNGEERFITLRPEDQKTRDYADKKIKWYIGHEDYPFANFNNPVLDNEHVSKGYMMTKATDRKYEEKMERLKSQNKMIWVYILLGIAGAIAITLFALNQWGGGLSNLGGSNGGGSSPSPPTAGMIPILGSFLKNKIKVLKA